MKKFKTLTELELLNAAYAHILVQWTRKADQNQELIEKNLPNDITKYWLNKYDEQLAELHAEILELENGPKYVEFAGNVYEVYERKKRTTVLMGGDGITIELPNDYFDTLTPLIEEDISNPYKSH